MSKSRHKTKRRKPSAERASPNGHNGHVAESVVVEHVPEAEAPQVAAPELVGSKYLPLIRGLLLVLLGLGLAWRFVGLKWDAGFHLHPDERFLTMVVPELRLPTSLAEWFRTASSPFNPYVSRPETGLFIYGQLPLLIAKFIAVRLSSDALNWDTYDGILLLGRALSAAFDAGTVLITWLIGRRLLGRDAGLLAAILLAFTALHIQQAHFFTVDTFGTFFLVLSFWGLLKWLDAGQARWAILAGAAWGLSAACKISALLFAPIVLLALLLPLGAIVSRRRARIQSQDLGSEISSKRILLGALALSIAALAAFRLGHPMAFRGELGSGLLGGFFDLRLASGTTIAGSDKTFWTSFAEQRDITIGQGDVPWNYQWFGRADFIWPLRNLLVWGVGWQAMLPALAALLWLPVRLIKRAEHRGWILIVAWVLLGFGYNAVQYSKFSRYFLVVTPFFALLAAWFAQRAWQMAQEKHGKYLQALHYGVKHNQRHKHWPLGAALLTGAMLGGTVCWGSAVTSIYNVPNTCVQASEFLQSQRPGARIVYESLWDITLPLAGQERFEMLDLKLVDREDAAWRANLIDVLDRADWMVICSPRFWASLPRLRQRFPTSTRYYQALFSGQLGLVPEREFTSYPQLNLFGWRIDFPDDNTEEALTVYDHPRVVLWQRGASWSRENAEAILDASLLDQVDNAPLSELIARGEPVDENTLPWLPSPSPAFDK